MKKLLLNCGAAALLIAASTPSFAGAVAGATEPTQLLNNAQLILQEAHQVEMVANQLRSLQSLATMNWGSAAQDLNNLTQIVSTGTSIAYTSSNLANQFAQQYPGYVPNQNYQSLYSQWNRNTLDSVSASLQTAGMQSNQFATERSSLNAIQALANNPTGQVQAIQAGTQISSMMVDQMQKLRQLNMAQMQSQNSYMAEQSQTRSTQIGTQQDHFAVYTPTSPTFSSAGGSN